MHTNIVKFTNPASECYFGTALLKNVLDDGVILETEFGVIKAGIAFSCLVAPQCGDRVLFSKSALECFVLAVLERETKQDMALDFPANVVINANSGNVTVKSGKNLDIIAAGKNSFLSTEMSIVSGEMNVATPKLTTRIQDMTSYLDNVKVFVDTLTQVSKFINQRADNIVRWVEGVETLNIGCLVQNVRKSMTSHAHQASITAKTDIRIDGERIHMG